MTISNARKKFEELKEAILEDKKVDLVEVYALRDFIEPYVRSGNKKFAQFEKLLKDVSADKKITDDESAELVKAIESMSKFLKTESVIEHVFFGGLAIALAAYLVVMLVKQFI